jgi:hypothetical protein
MMWAGYMEPPELPEGRGVAFGDFSHHEMIYDEQIVGAMGLDPSLASMGYVVAVRLRCLVIGLLRTGHAEFLPFHEMTSRRQWAMIWPPHGHRNWPPLVKLPPAIGMEPLPIWIRHA